MTILSIAIMQLCFGRSRQAQSHDGFLWNKLGDDDGNTFFPVFSKGGWKTEAQYTTTAGIVKCVKDTANGGEFTIERGLTIYFVNDNKVFGHVAMSLGDGTVISQNAVYGIADRSKIRPGEQAEVTKMETSGNAYYEYPSPDGYSLLPPKLLQNHDVVEWRLLGGICQVRKVKFSPSVSALLAMCYSLGLAYGSQAARLSQRVCRQTNPFNKDRCSQPFPSFIA